MEKQLDPPAEKLLNYEQMERDKLGGTTRRTIDRWLAEGLLPADCKVLISGSARFVESKVDEWIRAGCPGAGDE